MTQPGDVRIRRALLSVSDKTSVVDFARGLVELGVELEGLPGPGEVREALRPLEHDLLCEVVLLLARGAVVLEGGRCIVRADDAAG